MKPDVSVQIGKIKLENPIMPASGTFGEEFLELIDFNKLGALVPKSVTLLPRKGNNPPRIAETASGMLNSVGIQNKGINHFVNESLPFYEKFSPPLIVSISGHNESEFIEMVNILEKYDSIDGIELNISCPNLAVGGKSLGMSEDDTYKIVKAVRENTSKTVIVKLTPNVGNISFLALAAEEAGADAVSLINTITAMAIDIKTRKPKLGNITGGLSGPAIKPVAIRMVWEVSKVINIPIIGIGGIMNGNDALEFILAGASAVQVGTASFVNPESMINIITDIKKYMIENNTCSLKDLVGKVLIEK